MLTASFCFRRLFEPLCTPAEMGSDRRKPRPTRSSPIPQLAGPLVARMVYYGISNRLNRTNMDLDNTWAGPYDNIANWNELRG